MARGKAKEGADESGAQGDGGGLTQRELVKRALNELGYEAKTQAIHDYIRDKYQKELSNNIISSYKSNLRREAGVARGRGGRPSGRPAAANAAAMNVEDVQTVKELVGRLGADKVRGLVELFQ